VKGGAVTGGSEGWGESGVKGGGLNVKSGKGMSGSEG
jgi:hypothetical protein